MWAFISFLGCIRAQTLGSQVRISVEIPHQSFCCLLIFCSYAVLGHWFQLFFSYPRTIGFIRTVGGHLEAPQPEADA